MIKNVAGLAIAAVVALGCATLAHGWFPRGAPMASSYIGPVATRGRLPNGIVASTGQLMTRSHHIATTDITSLGLVLPNFYVQSGGAEVGSGSAATVTASIEYPSGACTVASVPSTVPNGGIVITGQASVNIPKGANFWVRVHWSGSGLLFANFIDAGAGEALNFGTTVPDKTANCDPVVYDGTEAMYWPAAIIGPTSSATACIIGDSIAYGFNDTFTGTTSLLGSIERSLSSTGFANTATTGNTVSGYISSHAGRNAVISAAGCTTIIDELGVNDLTDGGSAAAVLAGKQTIWGYFPGKWIAASTITPVSTSGDGWTSGTQTPTISTTLNALNTSLRSPAAGQNQLIEIANVFMSGVNSDLWKFGPSPPYTNDGTHPNVAGYALVPPSGAIDTNSFPRLPFLLKRDLDPVSNDHDPVWLAKAA